MSLGAFFADESMSNILSLIAIAISGYALFREKSTEKRNHEFELFQDLYKEYLIKRLPEARAKISITPGGMVSGEDIMIKELCSIRKDSLYFKYTDPEYFGKLRDVLWDLEDYLVVLNRPLNVRERAKFQTDLNKKIGKIYKCILKKF